MGCRRDETDELSRDEDSGLSSIGNLYSIRGRLTFPEGCATYISHLKFYVLIGLGKTSIRRAWNRDWPEPKSELRSNLKCGPMPNVMVALPNIGGALCSTPQSLADAHYLSAVQ